MRILFADSIDETTLEPLIADGHECVVEPSTTADDLPDRLEAVDVLVVRSTRVTAAAIESADTLGLIVRAGAGTDNVDKTAASAAGIYVCNVPGRNAVAVAELTMGLLIAVDRHIADATADLRDGEWNKGTYSDADGLHGRNLAIIGLGEIGFAVAKLAKAFGMTVSAVRREERGPEVLQRIRATGIHLVDNVESLLEGADIVSLHVPKSPSTDLMVDEAFLAKLNDGAIILNTARGGLIDEAALIAAMDNRGIRAGLDVWAEEPGVKSGSFVSKLAQHPSVVGSHHVGASTRQAQRSVAEGTVDVIRAFLQGSVTNCVNLKVGAMGDCNLTVRHYDEVGVLAQVLQVLRRNGHNVQQMQNQVFVGSGAAVARIGIRGVPPEALISELTDIAEVIGVSFNVNC